MCIRDSPNPVGPPSASAGAAAAGVGSSSGNGAGAWRQTWSPQEWEDWRRGSWRRPACAGVSASPHEHQSSS
eukprot:15062303-Alexandrium_andersonii.AAC.1